MNSVLTEIVEKTSSLSVAERNELIELLREQSNQIKPTENGRKKFVIHPNTAWIKENHAKYAGNYVALKDGEFVASGKTIKEANEKARSLGVENPFLHRITDEGEIPFGGW
jgi:Family of unknown function (DUF5678)